MNSLSDKNTLAVLGSTGSIGTQTLDVVRRNPERFEIATLSAHRNHELLLTQIEEFKPKLVAVTDEETGRAVKENVTPETKILMGPHALEESVSLPEVDTVVASVVGFAGLKSVLAAIKAEKDIAIANKEALVAGGELVMSALEHSKSRLVPIDSEHNSVFQCMLARRSCEAVKKVTITASGGPFWNRTSNWDSITPAEALKHPRWSMGAKNSLDSATMMNKALEVIEAAWLFDLKPEEIGVLVHPQSLVHGLIEFEDGMVLAAISETDMRIPISFALGFLSDGGERIKNCGASLLDLASHGKLEFFEPDAIRFPAIDLAYEVLRLGGSAGAVFNAANEVAGEAFLRGELNFGGISDIVAKTLNKFTDFSLSSGVDDIINADKKARELAEAQLNFTGVYNG